MDFQELAENKPGLIGVIVAVVGLLLVFVSPYLGLVALAGLIIASRGVTEEPKALAIGGISVGGLGVVLMLILNFTGGGSTGDGSADTSAVSPEASELELVVMRLRDLSVSVGTFVDAQGRLPEQLSELGGPDQMYFDPWGSLITLKKTGQNVFELLSNGPDRQAGSRDDVVVEGGF